MYVRKVTRAAPSGAVAPVAPPHLARHAWPRRDGHDGETHDGETHDGEGHDGEGHGEQGRFRIPSRPADKARAWER